MMAITSILSLVIASLSQWANKSVVTTRVFVTRDLLVNQLQRLAADQVALLNSSNYSGAGNANAEFATCTGGGAPGAAGAAPCENGTSVPFVLVDAINTRQAGTAGVPVYYDIDGGTCTTPSPTCFLLVTTAFVPHCPGQPTPATCPLAESVTITVTIAQAPGVDPVSGIPLKTKTATVTSMVPFSPNTSGSPNAIAKWMTMTTIGYSPNFVETGGRVGVGTTVPTGGVRFDVQGAVRVGNDGASITCSGGNGRGILRTSGANLQYCNGTGWTNINIPVWQ